ncbi:hypothetical protein ACQPYK_13955 [Streptosporangium sp. CA-135522]|uniref:hypothetical protein n=1 Tax=Streptosporangium sp. CA-135522 TaxID=3240072 RepID=UPI003D8C6FC0
MTEQSELLRRAEEKDLLASRLDGYAENLATLLEQIKTGSTGGQSVWTGLAAQRFAHDVVRRRSDADLLADQCRVTARNLRQAARRLREQARLSANPL